MSSTWHILSFASFPLLETYNLLSTRSTSHANHHRSRILMLLLCGFNTPQAAFSFQWYVHFSLFQAQSQFSASPFCMYALSLWRMRRLYIMHISRPLCDCTHRLVWRLIQIQQKTKGSDLYSSVCRLTFFAAVIWAVIILAAPERLLSLSCDCRMRQVAVCVYVLLYLLGADQF